MGRKSSDGERPWKSISNPRLRPESRPRRAGQCARHARQRYDDLASGNVKPKNAFEKASEGKLRFGAVGAVVVSASSFTLLGIGSAFWALLIAVAASLLVEREDLMEHWCTPSSGS